MPVLYLLTWSGSAVPPDTTIHGLCPWHYVPHTVGAQLMPTAYPLTQTCVPKAREKAQVDPAPRGDNFQWLLLDPNTPTPV